MRSKSSGDRSLAEQAVAATDAEATAVGGATSAEAGHIEMDLISSQPDGASNTDRLLGRSDVAAVPGGAPVGTSTPVKPAMTLQEQESVRSEACGMSTGSWHVDRFVAVSTG